MLGLHRPHGRIEPAATRPTATRRAAPSTISSPPTDQPVRMRLAALTAAVFLAATTAVTGLWWSVEPDCEHPRLAATAARCER